MQSTPTLKVSLYRDIRDPAPKPHQASWEDFASAFSEPPIRTPDKHSVPLWGPAEYPPGVSRSKRHALRAHCAVLDIDQVDRDLFSVWLDCVLQANLDCIIHSSYSHTDEHPKVRAIFRLDRPVEASEWPRFWASFYAFFGNIGDHSCSDISRIYYVPSAPLQGAQPFSFRFSGRPLPVEDLLASSAPLPASPAPEVDEAYRRATLQDLRAVRTRWSRLRRPHPSLAPLRAITEGEAWATPGHRDTILFRLCTDLERELPDCTIQSLTSLFECSCTHPDLNNEFPLSTVEYKLQRAREKRLQEAAQTAQEDLKKAAELAEIARNKIRETFHNTPWEGRDTPYTPEELSGFAARERATLEAFRSRWIIQRGSAYYIYVGPKGYVGPFTKDDAALACHQYLAPAQSVGVDLVDGEGLPRSLTSLVHEYGTVADQIVLDLTAQRSYYDADIRTLIEAPTPRRRIQPRHDPQIETWLRLLSGPEYPRLEKWLSYVTDLTRPCVALFLEGAPGAGKSLLAKGLARIWTVNQPTTLEQVLGNFNSQLAQCPLVLADEVLPKDLRGRAKTGQLREFIQADQHPYRRKFVPDGTLKGAARVVIASNNRSLLESEEDLTPDDVQAIVGRFLHIEAPKRASDYLASIDTSQWVSGDAIAAHALYLAETIPHEANPPRFLIEVDAKKLTQTLTTNTPIASAVAHWITGFLANPQALRAGKPPGSSAYLVTCRNGTVLVNPKAITENWTVYRTNVREERATAKAVSTALRSLSEPEKVKVTVGSLRPRFFRVRTGDLAEWVERNGFGDGESLQDQINTLEALDIASAPRDNASAN